MTQSHDQAPESGPPQAAAEPAVPGFQAPPAGYVYQDQPTHAYDQQPAPQPYPVAYGYPVAPLPQAPPAYGHYRRPGVITASAVLAFIQAGITALAVLFSFVNLFNSAFSTGRLLVQTLVVLATAVGVGLLIAGGVKIMAGTDRTLLMAACVLQFVICFFYIIVFATLSDGVFGPDDPSEMDDVRDGARGALIVFAVMFSILPIISLSMSRSRSATAFLRSRGVR